MTPVAGTGLSLGTVALIGGVIVVAGVAYLVFKNSNVQKTDSSSTQPIRKMLSDEDRYDTDKNIILTAINENDWETLEDLLDSSTKDFPDLIKMIEEALKNKR